MHVLIAYNEPVLPTTHAEAASEREILDVVNLITTHLDGSGVKLTRLGVGRDFAGFRDACRLAQPEVVLNLFEGFGDDPDSECRFARLLEVEGVAFTGASSYTLSRAGQKHIAKQAFAEAGLTTPAWMVVKSLPLADWRLTLPVIVKPAFRDASVGIDQSCVVAQPAQLAERIAHMAKQFGLPVLVEEFIEGREISVAIYDWSELSILPIVETKFTNANGYWSIDSYDAKWQPGSRDHGASSLHYPAELASELAKRIEKTAVAAYRALGCRGFATLDFRVRNNTPYLLELNPNADLKPSTCLTDLLRLSGIDYSDFLWQMIRTTCAQRAVLDHA
jgi:D-alanine-D-alanine ligase